MYPIFFFLLPLVVGYLIGLHVVVFAQLFIILLGFVWIIRSSSDGLEQLLFEFPLVFCTGIGIIIGDIVWFVANHKHIGFTLEILKSWFLP